MSIIMEYINKDLITKSLLNKLKVLGETDSEILMLHDLLEKDIKDSETCFIITRSIDINIIEMAILHVLRVVGDKNEEIKSIYKVLSSKPEFSFGEMFCRDYKKWSDDAKKMFYNDLVTYLDINDCDENNESIYYSLCNAFFNSVMSEWIIEFASEVVNKKLDYMFDLEKRSCDNNE